MLKRRTRNRELRQWAVSAPSDIHGTGVFAARDIGRGAYIGTYHGPTATRNGTYVLWVYDPDDPEEVVGISGRNVLRFLNHARPGNARFEGADLYARRSIRAGTEITFDYGAEWED